MIWSQFRRSEGLYALSKVFFFEKKNQKTFARPIWRELLVGYARANPPYANRLGMLIKVFCGAFFQKSDLLLSSSQGIFRL
jgi:hypothetical protein